MILERTMILMIILFQIIACDAFLGWCFMTSGLLGSIPSAIAGSQSVTRFIQRRWIASSGNGNQTRLATKRIKISPILLANR